MKTNLNKQDFISNGLDADEVSRLNRYFTHYKSKRESWAKRGKEYEEAVFCDVEGTGTMFTQEQLNTLKDKKVMSVSLSIGIAFIEQLQSFLTSSKPSINVIPVGNSSKLQAYIHRDLLTAILYLNNFQEKLEQAIQDQEIVGNGYIHVTFPDFFTYNAFNVAIKDLHWKNVYLDPMLTYRDIEDSEMVFIVNPLLKSKAKKVYNLTESEMKFVDSTYEGFDSACGNETFSFIGDASSDDYLVWAMEIYEKVFATMYILQDGTKTFTKPEKPTYIDGNGQIQNLVMKEIKRVFIKRTIKIGNYIKDSRIMPITKYPVIRYCHTHNRSPYSYGVMHHIIDLIHALEKCILLTFENAQGSSNANMIAPEGAIDNKEAFKKGRSTPNEVLTYTPDQNLPNGGKPEQLLPLPLNNAWYQLAQTLVKWIEYITGINELIQGNAENAPQTANATQNIMSFGTQRPKMYARRIDMANQKLGEVIIQFYQAYAPQENVIRYIDSTETMQEIMTNVSAIIDQQTGQAQPNPLGMDKMSLVKDESGKIIKQALGDISQGEFQVRIVSSSDLPTARAMASQILQSLMSRMGNDAMAVAIAQMSLKLMDIPEVDKLLRDVEIIGQLQQQVQNLSEQLDEAQKNEIRARHEADMSEKHSKLSDFQSQLDKLKNEAKTHVDKLGENVKEEIASQKAEEPEIR